MLSIRSVSRALIATALAASGLVIIPAALPATRLLLAPAPEDDVADYRLAQLEPQTYHTAVRQALDRDDPDLAASLVALAETRQVPLPSPLRDQVTAAQSFSAGRTWRETWKGLSGGEASSPEALAGAVAADLTGITDARDLLREGGAYLDGQPYDALTLGLATAGLAATGAVVVSFGTASPVRAGLTAIKIADKANALKPPMRRALTTLASDVLDRPALQETFTLLKGGQLQAARQALGRSVRAAPVRTLQTLASDIGTVASARGYRAAYDVLKLAESPRDVGRLRALATRFGPGFRGAAALLGTGMLTLSGLMVSLVGWLVAAGLWLLTALWFMYRAGRFAVRVSVYILRKIAGCSAQGRGKPPAPPPPPPPAAG